MKNLKTLALIVAVNAALLGRTVASAAETTQLPATTSTKPASSEKGKPAVVPATPSKPQRPAAPELPTDIKQLVEKFNAARDKFLDEEKDLRRKYVDASKEERDKLRSEIKDKRQAFLDQQKTLREDIRKQLADLKDQLKDHRDVINQAKEQVKEKVKERKGGSE